MSKRLTGTVIHLGETSIARGGEWKFNEILIRDAAGTEHRWEGYQMDIEVKDALRRGTLSTFYYSKMWATIYGLRRADGTTVFMARHTAWYMPLMSLGMISLGLAGAVLIVPLLLALAGAVGLLTWLDALGARRRFRRDSKSL